MRCRRVCGKRGDHRASRSVRLLVCPIVVTIGMLRPAQAPRKGGEAEHSWCRGCLPPVKHSTQGPHSKAIQREGCCACETIVAMQPGGLNHWEIKMPWGRRPPLQVNAG